TALSVPAAGAPDDRGGGVHDSNIAVAPQRSPRGSRAAAALDPWPGDDNRWLSRRLLPERRLAPAEEGQQAAQRADIAGGDVVGGGGDPPVAACSFGDQADRGEAVKE